MEIHREPLENYIKGNNARIYNNIFGDIGYPFIIGGGSARQIFLNEDFGSTDIDIYMIIGNFDDIYAEFQKQGKVISSTSNAITFELNEGIKIQLIRKVYTLDPCQLFSTYDFSCCMFAIKDNYIYYTDLAKDHALNKWLYIVHNKNINLARIGKYLLKGYTPLCLISQQIFVDFINYGNICGFGTDDMFAPTIEDTFIEFFGISRDY
jgi:hypothetical protein